MKKIVFMGSRNIGYNCLKYLLENKDTLECEIVSVLTDINSNLESDKNVLSLAKESNILIHDKLDDFLVEESVDLIISVQYHKILKKKHIEKSKLAINLHMAPLPEYRGSNQFCFAILNNDKIFGTTLHILDEGIDNGDIIAESRFNIPENCWIEDLYNLTCEKSFELFKNEIKKIINNEIKKIPQKDLIEKRGTSLHYRNEILDLKKIDLSWDKEKIERHIRATSMPNYEPPYTIIGNKKVYFKT